ncbi:MAG: patatin-like phospholipase family protein [Bacilli bacterium]|nr:patatin-like phospholipase family protein [Bacilli bacterium]
MKRAIVLSGGGSKGAYQIGVWKALKKLKIHYDIVTGTSVGALNAAIMTQNTFHKGLKLWYNLNSNMIFDEEIKEDYNTQEGKKIIIFSYFKNIIKGGMNVNNLEKTIINNVDLKKIYASKIDMGIVTFNVKTLKPLILTKNKIPREKLHAYLLASSSCFPAFKMKKIDEQKYIDGGIYDNLPINLAIKMGATEIIAVDLRELGIKKKIIDENIKIKYISPRNKIGSFLVFQSSFSRKAIKFGYNDTMKEFNFFEGNLYTFRNNQLNKNYKKYKDYYIENINLVLQNSKLYKKLLLIPSYKKILLSSNDEVIKKELNKMIEQIGLSFNLDESKIYRINQYNKLLKSKLLLINSDSKKNKLIEEKDIKNLFSNKFTIKYIYDCIKNNEEKKLNKLVILFPHEFLQAIYLKTIIDKK